MYRVMCSSKCASGLQKILRCCQDTCKSCCVYRTGGRDGDFQEQFMKGLVDLFLFGPMVQPTLVFSPFGSVRLASLAINGT